MSSEEKVIAIMGPTGVGKSSFIQNAVPPGLRTEIKVGHGILSETKEVQPVNWVTEDGTKVKLIDTPGFDDSRAGVTDTEVLRMIATFLTKEYEGKKLLNGLIYIHRITDIRAGATSQRNLRMFRKLCGDDSLKNVVIITTMWDKIAPDVGSRRELELMTSDSMFKPLLDGEAIMKRHYNTPQSAADVINLLLYKNATTIQIVHEIVDQKKTLAETAAGTELGKEIHALLKKHKDEMEGLKGQLKGMMQNEIAGERQRLDGVIVRLSEELEELKRGIAGPTGSRPRRNEVANNFPAPETKCVVDSSRLLQLVRKHESSLAPDILSSVASCAIHFADAVERSVEGIQRKSSTLKVVLESEDMDTLQQLMRSDPYPRTLTHGTWNKAGRDMEIVTNELEAILSTYSKPGIVSRVRNGKATRRFDALNAILESTREVVSDIETMVAWWAPVIDALGNVEDTAHRMRGGTSPEDSTDIFALTRRVIRALDSYCEAYARCPEDLHKAAQGLLF